MSVTSWKSAISDAGSHPREFLERMEVIRAENEPLYTSLKAEAGPAKYNYVMGCCHMKADSDPGVTKVYLIRARDAASGRYKERISLRLVSFHMKTREYDEAMAVLKEINTSSLPMGLQLRYAYYRGYLAHYTTVFTEELDSIRDGLLACTRAAPCQFFEEEVIHSSHIILGRFYLLLGYVPQALELLTPYIDSENLPPKQAHILHLELSVAYEATKEDQQAIKHADLALATNKLRGLDLGRALYVRVQADARVRDDLASQHSFLARYEGSLDAVRDHSPLLFKLQFAYLCASIYTLSRHHGEAYHLLKSWGIFGHEATAEQLALQGVVLTNADYFNDAYERFRRIDIAALSRPYPGLDLVELAAAAYRVAHYEAFKAAFTRDQNYCELAKLEWNNNHLDEARAAISKGFLIAIATRSLETFKSFIVVNGLYQLALEAPYEPSLKPIRTTGAALIRSWMVEMLDRLVALAAIDEQRASAITVLKRVTDLPFEGHVAFLYQAKCYYHLGLYADTDRQKRYYWRMCKQAAYNEYLSREQRTEIETAPIW